MKRLLVVLGVLAALLLVVVVMGLLLPQAHRASRSVQLARPPEEVWEVVTDFAGGAGWRDGVTLVEMLPPQDGRTVFRETSDFGPLTLIVDASEPPRRLVTRIL